MARLEIIILLFSISLSTTEELLILDEPHPYIIQTVNGPVQGIIGNSRNESRQFVKFVGLRYANPARRFEPPEPLQEKWDSPKLSDKGGSPCPQVSEGGNWHENEDCLFLNVYVPKSQLDKAKSKLPVMFWVHGGGFAFGDGFGFGPDYFMETEEVILVTINYRLGVLGFFSMEDDIFVANNGLRDLLMGLKWVRENIAEFQGDTENVVIFGNSAGSACVHYLMMSPLAQGLFHKAILQSGSFSFWSYSPNPKETGIKFASYLGCNSTNTLDIRKCLEGKSTREMLQTQVDFYPRWPKANGVSRFLPTALEKKDPFFASKPHSFFIGKGKTIYSSKVPVMLGITRNEGSTIFAASVFSEDGALDDFNKRWNHFAPKTFCYDSFFPLRNYGQMSSKLRQYYFGQSQFMTLEHSVDTLSVLYSDALFTLPLMTAAKEMVDEGMKVYPYMFSFAGNFSLRHLLNGVGLPGMVGHGDELQYLFPHEALGPPLEPDSIGAKFSKYFVQFWVHFAKNGKPAQTFVDGGEDLKWLAMKKTKKIEDVEVLRILTKPKVGKLEFADRLKFWEKLSNEMLKKGNEKSEL